MRRLTTQCRGEGFSLEDEQFRLVQFSGKPERRRLQFGAVAGIKEVEGISRWAGQLQLGRRARQKSGTGFEVPGRAQCRSQGGDHQRLIHRAVAPVTRSFGIHTVGRIRPQTVGDPCARQFQQISRRNRFFIADRQCAECKASETDLVPIVGRPMPTVVARPGIEAAGRGLYQVGRHRAGNTGVAESLDPAGHHLQVIGICGAGIGAAGAHRVIAEIGGG